MHRSPGAVPGLELDERDHQALDLLEELDCADAWIAAKRAAEAGSEDPAEAEATLDAALEDAGASRERLEAAISHARPLLTRLVAQVTAAVVDAAADLAATEHRGGLEGTALADLRQQLAEQPGLALGFDWATELTRERLGLDRDAIASALLDELCSASPDQPHADIAAAIGERLAAARRPTPSHDLRVFRSASVAIAGPSLRAASLASEHPEQLGLALRLVQLHDDPQTLVVAFDQALASIDGPPRDPLELIDGPKRKFTLVHAILAAIVLGLTLWHYLWR